MARTLLALALHGFVEQLWQSQQTRVGFLAADVFGGPQTVGRCGLLHLNFKLFGPFVGVQLRVRLSDQLAGAPTVAPTTLIHGPRAG